MCGDRPSSSSGIEDQICPKLLIECCLRLADKGQQRHDRRTQPRNHATWTACTLSRRVSGHVCSRCDSHNQRLRSTLLRNKTAPGAVHNGVPAGPAGAPPSPDRGQGTHQGCHDARKGAAGQEPAKVGGHLSRRVGRDSRGLLASIKQIAEAPLSEIEAAIPDAKAARSLHNACKARLKNPTVSATSKRAGAELLQSAKRARGSSPTSSAPLDGGGPAPVPPAEYEASLALPAAETDEGVLARTTLVTNRAPLVLAFAVELLRHTMPEQPPSSRLSLAQAVVSANSRSRAVGLGLERGPSADEQDFGHGQPRVRILGREVAVLKRGGYEWQGEEEQVEKDEKKEEGPDGEAGRDKVKSEPIGTLGAEQKKENSSSSNTAPGAAGTWSVSNLVTSKESRFVVRATQITAAAQRGPALEALMASVPQLRTASHNAWAMRVKRPDMFGSFTVREDSFDDGEGGCGDFLLKVLREAGTLDVLVVMTRWYGGVMLGPDRWRIMRNCLKEALAERLRVTGEQAGLGGEAVWGLDLEAMRSKSNAVSPAGSSRSLAAGVIGMPVHRPEAARGYLLRSFADRIEEEVEEETQSQTQRGDEQEEGGGEGDGKKTSTPKKTTGTTTSPARKRTTVRALNAEKEENLGRLLGALRLLYDSWADHLSPAELDRRAWSWYVAARPEVENGPSGWGAKGKLRLKDILALRRKADP